MKPDIKERWLKALRSGDYKQGMARLRRGDYFCCLGVLCDLFIKETEDADWSDEKGSLIGTEWFIPPRVKDWAGLESNTPEVSEGSLIDLNDGEGWAFHQIADAIERDL